MIPDVTIPSATWVELYAQTGITPGTPLVLMNKINWPMLLWTDSTPANTTDGVELWRDKDRKVRPGHTQVWVYLKGDPTPGAPATEGKLNVQVKT